MGTAAALDAQVQVVTQHPATSAMAKATVRHVCVRMALKAAVKAGHALTPTEIPAVLVADQEAGQILAKVAVALVVDQKKMGPLASAATAPMDFVSMGSAIASALPVRRATLVVAKEGSVDSVMGANVNAIAIRSRTASASLLISPSHLRPSKTFSAPTPASTTRIATAIFSMWELF